MFAEYLPAISRQMTAISRQITAIDGKTDSVLTLLSWKPINSGLKLSNSHEWGICSLANNQ
jgi:hypothetical protein